MRRADRLFQIIQILRRTKLPITAARIADELEVSKRTIYRDIADLIGQRVPVEGEAGAGYRLSEFYDLPPLMFTPDELEALMLGVELVQRLPDATLVHSAKDVLSKISAVMPEKLQNVLNQSAVIIKPEEFTVEKADTRKIRSAIRECRKLIIEYRSADGAISKRVIRPVVLGYDENHCLLISWCEKKESFRHFRTDRLISVSLLNERIDFNRMELISRWEEWREKELLRLKPLKTFDLSGNDENNHKL